MRAAVAVAGLLTLALLTGCERRPGPPVSLKSFTLHDAQGLFGGCALWAAEDRTAFVQSVGHLRAGRAGLWEKRYKINLTAEQWREVEQLVGAHHLLTTKMAERPGVPDEAQPIIVVVPQAGATVKLRKWANDQHPEFDPVYDYLRGLCRTDGELVHEGAFDPDWRPDGFERPW